MSESKETKKEYVGKLVITGALCLLWAILCASILSYAPQDLPTSFAYQESDHIGNAAGTIGMWCARVCTWSFGAGSYFLIAQLGLALLCYWLGWIKEPFLKTLGHFIMLVAFSGICSYTISSSTGSPIGPGGCVGALIKFVLDRFLLPAGAYVALMGLFSAGLLLVTPLRAISFLFWTTGLARSVVWLVAPFLRRIYQAKPEDAQVIDVFETAYSRLAQERVALPARRVTTYVESATLYSSQGFKVVQSEPRTTLAPANNTGVNVVSPTDARIVEANPNDFDRHAPYDKEHDTLFKATFGPQVYENPGPRGVSAGAVPTRSEQSAISSVGYDEQEHATQQVEQRVQDDVSSNVQQYVDERADDYQYPSIELLQPGEEVDYEQFREEIEERGRELERVCMTFGVELKVVDTQTGPVLTLYEVELKEGLRLQKLERLTNDLAVKLKAEHVRIVFPIPGKNAVGVEVPNQSRQTVRLREVLESCAHEAAQMDIPIFLGKDVVGNPMVADLAALPHLLVAGRTGTGKSVCLNSIIMSILMTRSPKQCKLVMIDPKMVELSPYQDIPHMLHPVVTDMEKAEALLEWAVDQMESRYRLFARVGARKLSEFNTMPLDVMRKRLRPHSEAEWLDFPKSMPSIVIIADEMADLIMTSGKDVETHIIRLAQKSRAVGIHLVLATQKPTVDVITGLIKSNLPARISFGVATQSDSRVVLDSKGAEQLLGNGDMLFLLPGTSQTLRGQGAYVSTPEIDSVVTTIAVEEHEYGVVIENPDRTQEPTESPDQADDLDELYFAAVELVINNGRASTSLLQRNFKIGYNRAARIIDDMERAKIISPFNPAKPQQAREVLVTLEQWQGAVPFDAQDSQAEEKTFKAKDSVSSNASVAPTEPVGVDPVERTKYDSPIPFVAAPMPDRYGNVASSAPLSHQKVRHTTPESVGLASRPAVAPAEALASTSTAVVEPKSETAPELDEAELQDEQQLSAQEELEERFESEEYAEEYDDEYDGGEEDDFDGDDRGSGSNGQAWTDEQWQKYMEFDNLGSDTNEQ